jgi:hypothetical protein
MILLLVQQGGPFTIIEQQREIFHYKLDLIDTKIDDATQKGTE